MTHFAAARARVLLRGFTLCSERPFVPGGELFRVEDAQP